MALDPVQYNKYIGSVTGPSWSTHETLSPPRNQSRTSEQDYFAKKSDDLYNLENIYYNSLMERLNGKSRVGYANQIALANALRGAGSVVGSGGPNRDIEGLAALRAYEEQAIPTAYATGQARTAEHLQNVGNLMDYNMLNASMDAKHRIAYLQAQAAADAANKQLLGRVLGGIASGSLMFLGSK